MRNGGMRDLGSYQFSTCTETRHLITCFILTVQDTEYIKEIKKHLLAKVNDPMKRNDLKKILEDETKSLGLIINERMINVPPEVAPPMHKALFEEIQGAFEDEVFNGKKAILFIKDDKEL